VVIVSTLPSHLIPNSVMVLTSALVVTATGTPILLCLFMPHRVLPDGSGCLHVYSLCGICLFSIELGQVLAVGRIKFREYIKSRVRGWPTDWSRAVAFHLRDSSCVVVSVVDPETFISDIRSL